MDICTKFYSPSVIQNVEAFSRTYGSFASKYGVITVLEVKAETPKTSQASARTNVGGPKTTPPIFLDATKSCFLTRTPLPRQ